MLVRLNSPEARVARRCRESMFTPEYKIHETLPAIQSMLLCHESVSAFVQRTAPHKEACESHDVHQRPRIVVVIHNGYSIGVRQDGIMA